MLPADNTFLLRRFACRLVLEISLRSQISRKKNKGFSIDEMLLFVKLKLSLTRYAV